MVDVWVPIRNELDHDYILRPCPFWHIPERYLPSLGDPLQWINIKDFALTILHKLGFEFDPLWWCSMISCFQDTLASGWIMPYIRNDNWFNEKGLTITKNPIIMFFVRTCLLKKGNGPVEYLQQKIIEWRESPLLSLQLCKVLTLIIPPPWSPTRLGTHTVHNMRITRWTGVAASPLS